MQAITLDLDACVCGDAQNTAAVRVHFSLKPFLDFLKTQADLEKTAKKSIYTYILDQFAAYPDAGHELLSGHMEQYSRLFSLVHTALSPIINDEQEQFWAISKPIYPCFYYGTAAFYQVLLDPLTGTLRKDIKLPPPDEMKQTMLSNFYRLILQHYYHFTVSGELHTIHSITDPETGLLRYYRLNVDNRFLEITTTMELPGLTLENLKAYITDDAHSLDVLQQLLPQEHFHISGMSIVSFTDVTTEYALESIKNTIIDHHEGGQDWDSSAISLALKTISGSGDLEFGLLPYLRLNHKTVLYDHVGLRSIVIEQARKSGMSETGYEALVRTFIDHPRRLIFPDIAAGQQENYPMLQLLAERGIRSYALFPLYYNARLAGCLEIYTTNPDVFNGKTLSRIESAFPLIAQLYQNIIIDFNNEIMNIVTGKFTTLQPSVQWRFNQAAYNYLKSGAKEKNLPIEPVFFKGVHPFYGAIDIRNSSIERNRMIRKDMRTHFELLQQTLDQLEPFIPGHILKQLPERRHDQPAAYMPELSDREIMKTDDYLQRQLPPYLNLLAAVHPEAAALVAGYFEKTGPGGPVFKHRDNYELSMQMINHAVSRHLEAFNAELQQVFPCYFEKFRTDGVEFDIYLGQALAPELPFNTALIADFRYRQLRAIAEIALTTAGLTAHLPLPLETTQLIFVYGKGIDINFRIDEQRFDVEGSYNIRYQMVKKRIDKAHVKGTAERLTQPGKIAIVYFDHTEAKEYLGYIRRLQEQQLLDELVEYLEVEELQGVEGLKALRVQVTAADKLN